MAAHSVVLLPGSVLPASLAYPALVAELGDDVDAVAKELELYARPEPPPGYTLDTEVDGVLRCADQHGFDRFHLVGYSGGGASALAFAARHPERLRSLTLLEPAWAGNWDDMSAAHRDLWHQYELLEQLPEDQFMREFMRLGVRPEVELPPPPTGEPPPWMSLRPAGIRAFLATFRSYDLSREALASFAQPVLIAVGGLSNPDDYGEIAERLARTMPDVTLRVFPERHHFDPPHRVEPAALAADLRALWARS